MPLLDKNGLPIKSRIDKTGSPFKAAFEAGISSAKATIVVDPRDVTYLYVEDTSAPKLILRGPYCASCMTVRYRRGNILGDLVLFIQSGDILEESQLSDLLFRNGSLNPFPSRVGGDKTTVQQQCFDTACQFRKSQAICRKTDSASQTEIRFSESANNIEDAEPNSAFTARNTNRNSNEPLLHGSDSRFSIPISDDDMTSRLLRIEMNMSMLSPFGDRVILKEELNRRDWRANNCTYCTFSGWDDCYITHVTSEKHLDNIKKAGRFVTMAEFTALDTAVLTALKRARKLPLTEELKNVPFLYGARNPGVPLEESKLVDILENLRSDFAVYDEDVIEQNFALYFKKVPRCNYCDVALNAANTISHVLSSGHVEKVLSQRMSFTPYDNSTMHKFLMAVRKMQYYHLEQERATTRRVTGRRRTTQDDDDFVTCPKQQENGLQNNSEPKMSASEFPIPFFGNPKELVDDPVDFDDPELAAIYHLCWENVPAVVEQLNILGFTYPVPFGRNDCLICPPRGGDNPNNYHYLTKAHRKQVQEGGMCFSKRHDLDVLKTAIDNATSKNKQITTPLNADYIEKKKEQLLDHVKDVVVAETQENTKEDEIQQANEDEPIINETQTAVELQNGDIPSEPASPTTDDSSEVDECDLPKPINTRQESIPDEPTPSKKSEDAFEHSPIPADSDSSMTWGSLVESCPRHHQSCSGTSILDSVQLNDRFGRLFCMIPNLERYCSSARHLASRCMAECPLCRVRSRCVCQYLTHLFSYRHLVEIYANDVMVCESDVQVWLTALDQIICSSEHFEPGWHLSNFWRGDPRWEIVLVTSSEQNAPRKKVENKKTTAEIKHSILKDHGYAHTVCLLGTHPERTTLMYSADSLRNEYRRLTVLLPPFEIFCEHPTKMIEMYNSKHCPLCKVRFRCNCEFMRHIFSDQHLENMILQIEVCIGDINSWIFLINEVIDLSGLDYSRMPVVNPANGELMYIPF